MSLQAPDAAEFMEAKHLVAELQAPAAALLEKHLERSKEWLPHQLVPYGRGQDFAVDYAWSPEETSVPEAVRSALFVNLLTEDNLPYYYGTIDQMFGQGEATDEWNRRWTAEENRHSIVLRDYLTVTRALDPVTLERARMAQVSGGQVPKPLTPQDGLVYVTLQELATRIAHFNTGEQIGDPAGYEIMKRVASDENRHYLFYRGLGDAALELDTSGMVIAMERQVREFEMPGAGIINFEAHAKAIAKAGIYDLSIHHKQILVPVILKHWNVENLTSLSDAAEQARDKLLERIGRIGRAAESLARRRQQQETANEEAAV